MGRSPCCAKEGLNKGAWTAIEDKILTDYISIHGEGKWRHLPKRAGLKRCGKSCRLRWLNYLRPDIKRGNITHDEEDLIIRLHKLLGNRWSLIAGRLPGRTDNEIKNYWNTIIGKKIQNKNSKLSPPSSGACSPSSSTGQNLAKKARPLSIGSDVVHTKATRCTKVIVSKEIEPLMVNYNNNNNNNSDRYEKIIETSSSLSLLPPFGNYEEEGINNNNALDFMADFEMDESFFTGLLNMDLSSEPPSCFENKVDDQVEVVNSNDETSTNIITHHRPLSPPTYSNNDNAPEFYDNSLHGSSQDFQSMLGIMKENEFDWLSTL